MTALDSGTLWDCSWARIVTVSSSSDTTAAGPLPWVEGWTFRQNQALLIFRQGARGGPATELRFDRGGGHFILKRQ